MDQNNAQGLVADAFARYVSLTSSEWDHLNALRVDTQSISTHRKLIQDGRPCDRIFVVQSGWLTVFKQLSDGGRQILNFRLAGDFVGVECLPYHLAPFSVAALTPCSVALLSRDLVDELQWKFPRLATALLGTVSANAAVLQQRLVSLGRRTAFSRVAHLLLELEVRLMRANAARGCWRQFPLTQQHIADCTGLTAPYVNRILKQMRNCGLARIAEDRLEITDPERLARMAGFRSDYLSLENGAHSLRVGVPTTVEPSWSPSPPMRLRATGASART